MQKTIALLTIVLWCSACKKPSSTPDSQHLPTTENDSVSHEVHSGTKLAQSVLDSIDKVNEESVAASGEDITKAMVFLKDGDSTIHLIANIRKDHRVFGYAAPDIHSERLLLLSVFTNDVENNPFGCKLGAYYDTGGMEDLKLKYLSTTGDFVKAVATGKAHPATTVYFEKRWLDLD